MPLDAPVTTATRLTNRIVHSIHPLRKARIPGALYVSATAAPSRLCRRAVSRWIDAGTRRAWHNLTERALAIAAGVWENQDEGRAGRSRRLPFQEPLSCSAIFYYSPSTAPVSPPAPPPPPIYDVQIRYQINAFGNEHITQYFAMRRYLNDAGFVRDPDEIVPDDEPEDQRYNRMTGRIASDKVGLLLGEPHVRVLQLLPKGVKPPAEADKLVRVDLQLASGFTANRQQWLHGQVREAIRDLKFREAVGYDSHDDTRLLGAIPAGQLDALLSDVRKRPLASRLAPLQSAWPIRVVEVRPDLPTPSGRPEPTPIPKGQEKIAPELRELLADAAKAPRRLGWK